MIYENKEAIKKVIENIKKEKPNRDCNQCNKIYHECQPKNKIMKQCDINFKIEIQKWNERLKRWEDRLNDINK